MSNPIISIIIPIYNAQQYLSRTLVSIKSQTFHSWELLCVNDGSTDCSLDILEEFVISDERFRIINQVNAGPAHARNHGLQEVHGSYVCFIDSDDTIEPTYLERLYEAAIQWNADIVMCNYASLSVGKVKNFHHGIPTGQVLDDKSFREHVLCRYILGNCAGLPSLCTKLYRLEWLREHNFQIPENRVRAEDWLFNLRCIESSPRFCAIDDVLYNYYQNEGSVMHSLRKGEWQQHFESMHILQDVNQRYKFHLEKQIAVQCVRGSIEHLLNLYAHQPILISAVDSIMSQKDFQSALHLVNMSNLPRMFQLIALALRYKFYGLAKILLKISAK